MLRTNSKKARENIRAYIIDNYEFSDCDDAPECETFADYAHAVWDVFNDEYMNNESQRRYNLNKCGTWQGVFEDWAQGLPGILDTCYYYNRSAVDDLGAILEETDDEKARYSESDAAHMLSYLIYREIANAVGF